VIIVRYLRSLTTSDTYTDTTATDNSAPAVPTSVSGDATNVWSTDATPNVTWTDSVDAGDDYFFTVNAYDQSGNEDNFVPNGGFEKLGTATNPESWGDAGCGGTGDYVQQNCSDSYEGDCSLRLVNGCSNYSFGPSLYNEGDIVKISVATKGSSGIARLYCYDDQSQLKTIVTTPASGSSAWVVSSAVGTVPAGCGAAGNFYIYLYNGDTLFDKLFLDKINSSTVTTGLDGYATSWTHGATDLSSPTKNLENSLETTTASTLADAADWYFNILPVDNAGNWTTATSTVHYGPFKIDTTIPTVSDNYGTKRWKLADIRSDDYVHSERWIGEWSRYDQNTAGRELYGVQRNSGNVDFSECQQK